MPVPGALPYRWASLILLVPAFRAITDGVRIAGGAGWRSVAVSQCRSVDALCHRSDLCNNRDIAGIAAVHRADPAWFDRWTWDCNNDAGTVRQTALTITVETLSRKGSKYRARSLEVTEVGGVGFAQNCADLGADGIQRHTSFFRDGLGRLPAK